MDVKTIFGCKKEVVNMVMSVSVKIKVISAVVFNEPSYGGFGNFFPTGTYAGIGTTCVEFENVMKSTMIKKDWF